MLASRYVARIVADPVLLGQAGPDGEVPVALDRVDDLVALMSLQPRRRGGTFANFAMFRPTRNGWVDIADNGEPWVDGPRPKGRLLRSTGTTSVETDTGLYGISAGTVGEDVDALYVSSPCDEHAVQFDTTRGHFVLALKFAADEYGRFELQGAIDGEVVRLLPRSHA